MVTLTVELRMETIRVIHHHEPEGWWSESPDIQGWAAAGATYDEVNQLAEEGVRFALERDDVVVKHFLPAGDARSV